MTSEIPMPLCSHIMPGTEEASHRATAIIIFKPNTDYKSNQGCSNPLQSTGHSTYSSCITLKTSLHTMQPMEKTGRAGLKTWVMMKSPASDRSLPIAQLLCCALLPFPVCLASIFCSQLPSHVWALKSCLRQILSLLALFHNQDPSLW